MGQYATGNANIAAQAFQPPLTPSHPLLAHHPHPSQHPPNNPPTNYSRSGANVHFLVSIKCRGLNTHKSTHKLLPNTSTLFAHTAVPSR